MHLTAAALRSLPRFTFVHVTAPRLRAQMTMARLALLLAVLVMVCAQSGRVLSQEEFQVLPDTSFASTEPDQRYAFDDEPSFAAEDSTFDDDVAAAPEPEGGLFNSTNHDSSDPESDAQLNGDGDETTSADSDDDTLISDNDIGGGVGNNTAADTDGFDMVENDGDDDDSSTQDSPEDFGAASFSSRGSCSTGNPIDDCWRCDPNWASYRQRLASCAIGFGRRATGGRNGRVYVVTSSRDDNPANPAPGTLRYGVTRSGPLWITFAYSMTIRLKNELLITSYKTIDGRGVTVRIAGGAGLTMQRVNNVIVHGIAIHDIKPTGPARIMSSTSHVGSRGRTDGDAISIFSSKDIWIDHCYLARAADGLIDVIRGSSAVSITNNYFTQHDKVMLLGANKEHWEDRNMYVTVAYNTFGPGLMQRMPRVRFGNVHVVNNDYTSGWGIYAIAGSEGPTILSQGNIFNAYRGSKQVTKRINDGGSTFGGPKNWNWKSEGDRFVSGAYFTSVPMKWSYQSYSKTASCSARPATLVTRMVRGAGPLRCQRGARC